MPQAHGTQAPCSDLVPFATFVAALVVAIAYPTTSTAVPVSVTTQVASDCRSATDKNTTALQNYLISMATGTDSVSRRRRIAYNIPNVTSPGQVTVVSAQDTATCRRARAAYAAAVGSDTTAIAGVDIIEIRSASVIRYVVADYQVHAGEFRIEAIFDTSFAHFASMAN